MGKIRAREPETPLGSLQKRRQTKFQKALTTNAVYRTPQDAKDLMNILDCVRTIRIGQIQYFGPHTTVGKARRMIKTVVKLQKGYYSKERDYLLRRADYKPDSRIDDAMWMPILFMESGVKCHFFKPMAPASIGFNTKDKAYIVVATNNMDELYKAAKEIDGQYKKYHFIDDPTKLQYIFMIHHPEVLINFPTEIEIPYMVCLQEYVYDDTMHFRPKHTYYFPNNGIERQWRIALRMARKNLREEEEAKAKESAS